MWIKLLQYKFQKSFIYPQSIILSKEARIGIHHLTNLRLKNSKILVEKGVFKVGIDYGYYDGGMFDSGRDVCRIELDNATLRILGNVTFYPGVQLFAKNAEVTIGSDTMINGGTQILALKSIEIGSDCFFAQGVMVRDNDGHKISTDEHAPALHCLPVKIGNHCWLGQRSMVLKGAQLGNNVVVAAGAVVTRDFAGNTLVAGMPAKQISATVSWEG
jgi:acetyltransferase-like isoleucine patch superfamily enzyme